MRRLRGVAAGAASGVLVGISFPPARLSLLVFAALVPLLLHVRRSEGRDVGWPFFAYGVVHLSIGLFWLRTVVTPVGPILLALLLTVLFVWPLGHALGYLLRRGWSLLVAAPIAFLLSEWLRTWLFTGFPWLFLAHPLADYPILVQAADLFGAYGQTAVVALANAGVVLAVERARAGGGRRALVPLAWPAAAVAALLVYGAIRPGTVEERPGPRVLLVQGNIPQFQKNEGRAFADRILRTHLELTAEGVRRHPEVELVVWPETMFPWRIGGGDRGVAEDLARVSRAAGGRPVILGAAFNDGGPRSRNSAFLVLPGGGLGDRYDKIHLVPGGEYIPLRTIAPAAILEWVAARIRESAGFVPDLDAGEATVVMEVGGVGWAPLICYETCYPGLVRDAAAAGADVLLNLSNYGWYPETAEPEQALQYGIYRAVEVRRPLVVAANTGISGIVSPTGRVERLLVRGKEKDVAGVFAGAVPRTEAASLYAVVGDVLPWTAGFALLFALFAGIMSRLRLRAGRVGG